MTAYAAPRTVAEATKALRGGARIVAGGSDLVVAARVGRATLPERIVSLHALDEIRGIRATGGGVEIGAGTSHTAIVDDGTIRDRFAALADASAIVGSHATRNVGTIGGNVMNASPAMDTGAPLVVFDAVATLTSSRGSRELPVAKLWAGPGKTKARPGEILTSIALPDPGKGSGSSYVRLEYRQQMEIAIVGAAARVRVEGGKVVEAAVAITAVTPTIRAVDAAAKALIGTDGGAAAVNAAAKAAARAAKPISDVRGSARYRKAMVEVIARRAIQAAIERAAGRGPAIPASPNLHGAVA